MNGENERDDERGVSFYAEPGQNQKNKESIGDVKQNTGQVVAKRIEFPKPVICHVRNYR